MAKIDIITTSGEKKGSVELKKARSVSNTLVSGVVIANLSNKRKAIAHTKTRAEVSGGGKKPWRQKGTGRARAGSNRSPLWIGGGTTFGPRNNANFYKRVNKKQKTLVINELFARKVEEGTFRIVDEIILNSGKTKDMIKLLSSMGVDGSSLLVLDDKLSADESGTKIYNAGRNIDFLRIINLDKINAFMILKYKWLIITKEAFEKINGKFAEIKEKQEVAVSVDEKPEKKVVKKATKTVKKVKKEEE